MRVDEFMKHDGAGLAELVARKEVTAAELLEAALARADAVNGRLNAIVYRADDEARRVARGPLPAGPFAGVPFLIKDLFCDVAGWPMSNGTRWFKDYVSKSDSELTRRFRAAGLVLMGKTNTPEFGITGTTESAHLGPCRSPFGDNRIAGGSSGGSAAAVAAGIVPMAHASDGLGSIRIPAACNGLVGLKVTRARNPSELPGVMTGLAVNHIVSVSVRDTAVMLDAISGTEAYQPFAAPPGPKSFAAEAKRAPGRLRIAFSGENPSNTPMHEDVAAGLKETARRLEALGHDVFERPLKIDYRALYRAQGVHSAGHFAASIAYGTELLGHPPAEGDFERLTASIITNAKRVPAEMAAFGSLTLYRLSREIMRQFDDFDVFLCPTMITPPPQIGYIDPVNLEPKELNRRQAHVFGYTPPFNMTGQPSLSLPLAWSKDGLPIGMMFTGRYADEATLLSLAAQLEAAHPWAQHRPVHVQGKAA